MASGLVDRRDEALGGETAGVAEAGGAETEASAEVRGAGGAETEASAEAGGAGAEDGGVGAYGQPAGQAGFSFSVSRLAFASMQAELEAMPSRGLVVVRVDLQRAAAVAHSVAVRDSMPERRRDFLKVSETGFYSIETLDRLALIARAAWYVRRQQRRTIAQASGAVVSEEDLRRAYETRGRMMTVLGHWLGDRPDIASELRHLREGSGHEDLGTDLDTLAELYQRDDVRPAIERDAKHYRVSDVDDALRLVDVIFASLGLVGEGEVEYATRLAQRAATLLLRTYDKHCNCGRFVFGEREDVKVTYPSLVTAARHQRRRRREAGPDDGEGGEAGDE